MKGAKLELTIWCARVISATETSLSKDLLQLELTVTSELLQFQWPPGSENIFPISLITQSVAFRDINFGETPRDGETIFNWCKRSKSSGVGAAATWPIWRSLQLCFPFYFVKLWHFLRLCPSFSENDWSVSFSCGDEESAFQFFSSCFIIFSDSHVSHEAPSPSIILVANEIPILRS